MDLRAFGVAHFSSRGTEPYLLTLSPCGSSFLFAPMSHSLRLRSQEAGTVTANVGRADKGVSQAPARTPRSCSAAASRLAERAGARKAKGMPAQFPRSNARSGHDRTRSRNQRTARQSVQCGVVLERTPPPSKLDRKESTKLSPKYRRGKGEILIVRHAGRGWRDPTSDAKGDVFGLVQRLDPGLTFGHARKRLREFAGLSPSFPPADRAEHRRGLDRPVAERWAERKAVRPNSPTWRYLAIEQRLPAKIIESASAAGVLREGPVGSAWFAHFDAEGVVAHVDVRGPTYKGALTGGAKSMFCLHASGSPRPRLVLAEAAIDALSVAAIENLREDTLYSATGGGMGPGTSRRSRR